MGSASGTSALRKVSFNCRRAIKRAWNLPINSCRDCWAALICEVGAVVNVPPITKFIEPHDFEAGVKQEAPSILRKLMDLPLTEQSGRFWLPVVQTSLKES